MRTSLSLRRRGWRAAPRHVTMCILLAAAPLAAQQSVAVSGGGTRPLQFLMSKSVDPCSIASADTLRILIAAGIGQYFPITSSHDGKHVTVSHPDLRTVTCPKLHIELRADIEYRQTSGFPQFQTSGSLRLASSLVGRVTYVGSAGTPVQASNLRSAMVCMTSVDVTSLDLNNVPNWLDDTWIRNWLNGRLPNTVCFDVTGLLDLYLAQGHSL